MDSKKQIEHALLLSGHNGLYQVETDTGILRCRGASRIRKDGLKLVAGDRVTVEDNGDGTGFIRETEARKNVLTRPPVANIDLLIPVVAGAEPKTDPFLLDKLLVIAEKERIPVVIAITKAELGKTEELLSIYRKTPYPICLLSEHGKVGADALRAHMQGKISVFCGASGVGKSTLLNALFPSLHANVGELSEKIRRGKNTTRTTSLYPVGPHTYIADTPGFTLLDTDRYCRIAKEELCDLFPEFSPYVGTCRYTRCTHTCEEECSILAACANGEIAPERQESYRRLYQERKNNPSYLYETNKKERSNQYEK